MNIARLVLHAGAVIPRKQKGTDEARRRACSKNHGAIITCTRAMLLGKAQKGIDHGFFDFGEVNAMTATVSFFSRSKIDGDRPGGLLRSRNGCVVTHGDPLL
jgi:hypothetical protein